MQKEKLAIIALIIIVVCAISAFLVLEYGDVILKNLTGQKNTIKLGDCADVNYIGRYASNNTVFDSSYNDTASKTGGVPLNIFVSFNETQIPPSGYENYTSGIIKGLMDELIGLKEGETATIGPISPEDAYGVYPKTGDVISIADPQTGKEMKITIVNIIKNSTMPEEYIDYFGNGTTTLFILRDDSYSIGDTIPMYSSWENATVVTKINETKMWMYTTPPEDKRENFTWIEISSSQIQTTYWENASSVTSINDSTIVITHNPEINATMTAYDIYYGYSMTYTVEKITAEKINVSYTDESTGNKSYSEINRTITITRNESQNITYTYPSQAMEQLLEVIKMYYNPDLNLSLHKLAGEYLIFEVKIEKVYKTS